MLKVIEKINFIMYKPVEQLIYNANLIWGEIINLNLGLG